MKASNRKSFSGNEGKDMKQQNFFTANKKQYTVYKLLPLTDGLLSTLNTLLLFQEQVVNCLPDGCQPEFLVILGASVDDVRSLWSVHLNGIFIGDYMKSNSITVYSTCLTISLVSQFICKNIFVKICIALMRHNSISEQTIMLKFSLILVWWWESLSTKFHSRRSITQWVTHP